MSTLKTTDFVGYHKLAGSKENDELLQVWIDKYEKKAVYLLFGVKLGDLILANLTGTPPSPANATYKKVWDTLHEEGTNEEQLVSDGVLEIMKSYVFWHYIAETAARHTQGGVTLTESDTARIMNAARFAESRWNAMLTSWENIHEYMDQNIGNYPDWVYVDPPEPKFDALL